MLVVGTCDEKKEKRSSRDIVDTISHLGPAGPVQWFNQILLLLFILCQE